jgi:cytochrome c peroxidase
MPLEADKELTAERIALGKKLFFDPILSRDYTISCATCHLTNLAFTDGVPVAVGIEGRKHFRNSPTLFNVAWQPYLFMDGGNPSLESQVLGPVEEHVEMDLPFPDALARVVNHPEYPDLFQEAFDADPNPYTLTTALATFQRALVSYDSPFDRYRYHGESEALSAAAKRGLALFESAKLNCSACHQFPLTTNFAFENNGLKADYQADPGRARVTNNLADDEGKFKVATLRNIALTGPYMHDGSLVSLEEVIEHYASGGSQHRLQSNLVQGFSISDQEKADLIAFLHSLTDTSSYHLYVK